MVSEDGFAPTCSRTPSSEAHEAQRTTRASIPGSHSQHHRPQLISMVFKGARAAPRNVSPARSKEVCLPWQVHSSPSLWYPPPFFLTKCLGFFGFFSKCLVCNIKIRSLFPFDSSGNRFAKGKMYISRRSLSPKFPLRKGQEGLKRTIYMSYTHLTSTKTP